MTIMNPNHIGIIAPNTACLLALNRIRAFPSPERLQFSLVPEVHLG